MLLKVLHKSPEPIRVFIPKLRGKGDNHNNKEIIMKLKQRGLLRAQYLMGLQGDKCYWKSYINLQDQLGFSYPNRKGKGDNHNNKEIIMKLKYEGFSRVQYLIGLHGG